MKHYHRRVTEKIDQAQILSAMGMLTLGLWLVLGIDTWTFYAKFRPVWRVASDQVWAALFASTGSFYCIALFLRTRTYVNRRFALALELVAVVSCFLTFTALSVLVAAARPEAITTPVLFYVAFYIALTSVDVYKRCRQIW